MIAAAQERAPDDGGDRCPPHLLQPRHEVPQDDDLLQDRRARRVHQQRRIGPPVIRRRGGHDEPVHPERHREQVDPEPRRGDHREERDAAREVATRPVPRETDAADALPVAPDQMDHEERGRETEDEPEELVREQRVLIRGVRHGPPHRGRDERHDRVRGARQQRDREDGEHLLVEGASVRGGRRRGRELHRGKRSSHRIRVRSATG